MRMTMLMKGSEPKINLSGELNKIISKFKVLIVFPRMTANVTCPTQSYPMLGARMHQQQAVGRQGASWLAIRQVLSYDF